MAMNLFATGIVLGIVISVPPGPNAALCIDLARGGVRRAIPLITGAALTDAAYSLLAASGVLIAGRASSSALAVLAPCFLLGTAILFWSPASISPKAAVGIALLNPATAAIWLSLSSTPALRAISTPDLLIRPLPVALGTAAWFTLLAVVSAKLSFRLTPQLTANLRKLLAVSLAVLGLVSLGPILF
ncbi:MAG TPA: LysE family transporter [Solirubrobacterales bacterium]|nr:LysE family transporter [Solirubrobacterales bacterium]